MVWTQGSELVWARIGSESELTEVWPQTSGCQRTTCDLKASAHASEKKAIRVTTTCDLKKHQRMRRKKQSHGDLRTESISACVEKKSLDEERARHGDVLDLSAHRAAAEWDLPGRGARNVPTFMASVVVTRPDRAAAVERDGPRSTSPASGWPMGIVGVPGTCLWVCQPQRPTDGICEVQYFYIASAGVFWPRGCSRSVTVDGPRFPSQAGSRPAGQWHTSGLYVFVKGALRRTLAQDSAPDGKRRLRAPGTQLLIRAHLGDQWGRRPARKPRLAPVHRQDRVH